MTCSTKELVVTIPSYKLKYVWSLTWNLNHELVFKKLPFHVENYVTYIRQISN